MTDKETQEVPVQAESNEEDTKQVEPASAEGEGDVKHPESVSELKKRTASDAELG